MILFLGVLLGSLSVITTSCGAQDRESHNELQVLSCEKEELEGEFSQIASVLSEQKNHIDRAQHTMDSLLSQTESQNKKIQEHLNTLMAWGAQKKVQKNQKIFDKTSVVKEYLAQAAIASQYEGLENDQKKMTELKGHIQNLTKENEILAQKMNDRQGLIAQLAQKQKNLYSQIESSRRIAEPEISLTSSVSGVPKVTVAATPLASGDMQHLAYPLPDFAQRSSKSLFGAHCITAKEAEPISAIYDGDVVFSDNLKGLGQVIMIQHSHGYLSVYGNCKKLLKKVGDRVSVKDLIALAGHTGQLGEDCLYFEIRHNDRSVDLPHWFTVQN
jgi:septal ring factor EnvC (AmiA/AmiB activator)